MKHLFVIITAAAIILIPNKVMAQCDNSLVETAIKNLNDNRVFIRDFMIKLNKATPRKPEPVAKYSFYIQNGLRYQLNVVNATENGQKAIIQVYKKDELISTNYNKGLDETVENVEFRCNESGIYRLYATFPGGESGCAAIILSMIMDESKIIKEDSVEYETIYANTEIPLEVYSSSPSNFRVEHDISKGNLYKKNNEMFMMVADTGFTEIKTTVYDENGNIIEEGVTIFNVVNRPEPYVTLNGQRGGIINKINIDANDELKISGLPEELLYNYVITGFKIGSHLNDFNAVRSFDQFINLQQYKFINGLSDGDKFYIFDIVIKGPENAIIETKPLGFIIYE